MKVISDGQQNFPSDSLFVDYHQALRHSAACPDEVDTFLVFDSRDKQLRFFSKESLNLLT